MFCRLSLSVAAFLLGAGAALAQTQAPEPKAAEHSVAEVVDWVKRDGTEAILSHDIARAFGWGEANVPVTRMAFTNPESQTSFAFDVVRDKPNAVMIRRDPGEMIIWQMSNTGELQKTLHATRTGVTPVENALYEAKWREVLAVYFGFLPPR